MKSLMRIIGIFSLLLVFTLSPVLTAAAQDDSGINCRGLSEEDCQILLDSAETMVGLQSISVPAWSASFTMVSQEESVNLAASGSARAILPPAAAVMMGTMQQAQTGDTEAMQTLLGQVNSALIQQMISDAVLQFVLSDLTIDSPDESVTINDIELAVKDGIVYLHAVAPNGATGWFGEAIELSETDLADLDTSIAEMQESLESTDMTEMMETMPELTEFQEALMGIINQYITTTRGADDTLHGQSMATFTTTFDLQGLLADPNLVDVLMNFVTTMSEQSGEPVDMTPGQLTLVLTMVQLVLDDSQMFSFQQWVGLDDNYLHKAQLDIVLDADMTTLAADAGALSINLSAAIEMDEFNTVTPESVEVPTEYYDLDESDSFLITLGTGMETVVEPGQTVSGDLDDVDQLIYGFQATAGQSVTVTIDEDDWVYTSLYGPDGFEIDIDTYADPITFTAEQDGVYMISLSGYGAFDLTIQ